MQGQKLQIKPTEKIEIIDVDKQIQDNLEVIGLSLTPLQKWLFKVFLTERKPYATRALYDKLVLDTYYTYFFSGSFIVPELHHYLPAQEKVSQIELIDDVKDIEKNINHYKRETRNLSRSDTVKWAFREMKEKSPKLIPPSIRQVASDLNTLKQRGLITLMHTTGKKADTYWILNPTFYSLFKDQIPHLIEMH